LIVACKFLGRPARIEDKEKGEKEKKGEKEEKGEREEKGVLLKQCGTISQSRNLPKP
jgi:hypothetical protein